MTTTNTPYGAGAICRLPVRSMEGMLPQIRLMFYNIIDTYGQNSAPILAEYELLVKTTVLDRLARIMESMDGQIRRDREGNRMRLVMGAELLGELLTTQNADAKVTHTHSEEFTRTFNLYVREVKGVVNWTSKDIRLPVKVEMVNEKYVPVPLTPAKKAELAALSRSVQKEAAAPVAGVKELQPGDTIANIYQSFSLTVRKGTQLPA